MKAALGPLAAAHTLSESYKYAHGERQEGSTDQGTQKREMTHDGEDEIHPEGGRP